MEPETGKQREAPRPSLAPGEAQTAASKHIVDYPGCRGTLSWDDTGHRHQAAISFAVNVDQAGEIHLDIEDQQLAEDNLWINHAFSRSSPVVPMLQLDGHNADGLALHSDSVHLVSVHTSSTQGLTILRIRASAQRLTGLFTNEASDPTQEYQAAYWVAGMRWYGDTRFAVPEGEISISGDTTPDDYTAMTGTVGVRSPSQGRSLDSWIADIEPAIHRTLDVVSFADGHFMRPAVRQVFRDRQPARVDFLGAGQGSRPHQPPLHYLDFANSLPPLIRAYTQDLIDRTGIGVAIEWHLMPHLYNEARFVSQMTAIEHLIHVFSERSPSSTYIDKSTFNTIVAPAMIRTLSQELARLPLDNTKRSAVQRDMTQSLKGTNRRSLRSNLNRMISAYSVPLDELETLIRSLIDMRNDIVHRGVPREADDDPNLTQRVAEAEELVKRIILALLGFQGRYRSWLNDVGDRQFNVTA